MTPEQIDILTQAPELMLAKLNQDHGDTYEIKAYPDNPEDYVLTHPKGAMLVIFNNWSLQKPTTSVGTDQDTYIKFQVSLFNRSLLKDKENPGAYEMIKKSFRSLYGLRINEQALYCTDISLVSIKGNKYHYAQLWRVPVWMT